MAPFLRNSAIVSFMTLRILKQQVESTAPLESKVDPGDRFEDKT
jgi:hypothetical protein